jgi:hypothetical protein
MALNINLDPLALERLRAGQLGKFNTLATAVAVNAGIDPAATFNDKTLNDLDTELFEAGLDRLLAINAADGYAIGSLGSAYVVAKSNFSANGKKMRIIQRTSSSKTLSVTVKGDTATGNTVAINGSFCDIGYGTYGVATVTPVDPADVTPVGYVFKGGSNVGGGRTSPDGFFAQQGTTGAPTFGKGNATGGDGLGGLTPMIIKQPAPLNKVWRYGEKNVYANLPSGADAPATGDPGGYASYLTVRSSKQYADQNKANLGKAMLGYHTTKDLLMVIVQENAPDSGGQKLDYYRDIFFNMGFENVVGMDGSDSVLFFDYKTKQLLVSPGSTKDNYLEIAVKLTN